MLNQIINGDSIEIIKSIEKESIHAIISDIPYGISHEEWDVLHNNTNSALGGTTESQLKCGTLFKRRGKPLNGWSEADKKIPKEYQEWCSLWAGNWLRVLKPGASCFIFAGRRYVHRCIVALEDAGVTFKDMLCWKRNTAPSRAQRLSEIYKRRGDNINTEKWEGWRVANLRPVFEPILWFQKPYKTGGTIADNVLKHGVGAWNEEAFYLCNSENYDHTSCSNILSFPFSKNDYGLHETQKPLKLIEFLIALTTKEGTTILDPFAGSGTTLLAAKNLNRNYIGIEIDNKYAEIAKNRLDNNRHIQLRVI
jgi:site-specific DNA-methyltransferase (adenine-specific)